MVLTGRYFVEQNDFVHFENQGDSQIFRQLDHFETSYKSSVFNRFYPVKMPVLYMAQINLQVDAVTKYPTSVVFFLGTKNTNSLQVQIFFRKQLTTVSRTETIYFNETLKTCFLETNISRFGEISEKVFTLYTGCAAG